MCQVNKEFVVNEAGDINATIAQLQLLPAVNSAIMTDGEIYVTFDHHHCAEEDIKRIITQNGFEVKN